MQFRREAKSVKVSFPGFLIEHAPVSKHEGEQVNPPSGKAGAYLSLRLKLNIAKLVMFLQQSN
eukprot:3613831-Rhodomonas_salina.1